MCVYMHVLFIFTHMCIYTCIHISNSDDSGINLQRGFHCDCTLAEEFILLLPKKELMESLFCSLFKVTYYMLKVRNQKIGCYPKQDYVTLDIQ